MPASAVNGMKDGIEGMPDDGLFGKIKGMLSGLLNMFGGLTGNASQESESTESVEPYFNEVAFSTGTDSTAEVTETAEVETSADVTEAPDEENTPLTVQPAFEAEATGETTAQPEKELSTTQQIWRGMTRVPKLIDNLTDDEDGNALDWDDPAP